MTQSDADGGLLSLARSVLDLDHRALRGVRFLIAALLARRALEEAINAFWAEREPEVVQATMRAKLLCLRVFVEQRMVERATYAWLALSRACHHHPYELPPGAAEVDALIGLVEEIAPALKGTQKVSV